MEMTVKWCTRPCIYRGTPNFNGCDYCYITGKARGCPPGKGCTRFKKGKRIKGPRAYSPEGQEEEEYT